MLPAFGYLPAAGGVSLSLAPLERVAATPGIARSCALSLGVGLAATAVSLALVALFVASWQNTRAFRWMERALAPLLAVPHAAAAFGLALLVAPAGLLARLFSPWATGWERPPDILVIGDTMGLAMLAGLVVKEVPFLLLVSLAALPQVRAPALMKTACSLGYGRVRGFLLGAFPILYAQIRLPVYAVLAYATSVVDVALILGPTTPPPLAVRVLQAMGDPDLAARFTASAGAFAQLCVTLAALLVWRGGEWGAAALGHALLRSGRRGGRGEVLRPFVAAAMIACAAAVFGGLLALGIWSVAGFWRFPDALPMGLDLSAWKRIGSDMGGPIVNTLLVAGLSTLLALALVLGCLEHEDRRGRGTTARALLLLYLPLLVPQIAFLFGLDTAFTLARLDATLAAVVLAHLVFVFPYAFLSLSNAWRALDRRYARAALALGTSPARVFWRVKLPMLTRAVLAAAAIGFAVSVAQYLPTLLVGAGRWPTVTTEAVALASGGDRRAIGATALLQALLVVPAFALASLLPAMLFRDRQGLRT